MQRRVLVGAVVLLEVVLLLLVVGAAAATVAGQPGAGPAPVTLTIFTGNATIQRAGGKAAHPAHSGDGVRTGDSVATDATGKASLSYPDGSTTRLDSDTRVTVSVIRAAKGAQHASFQQSAGLTWNKVKRLVGGSTFKVSGPNSAIAEVRGTDFGYYVEHDAAGNPVIWIDTWSGSVLVSGAIGPAVLATTGTRVTVRAGAAPTVPAPIPTGDRRLPFTVFNQTLDAVTGTPISFETGALSTGGTTAAYSVQADGKKDLQFVLGWPGSILELTVVDPAGKLYAKPASTTPPISVVVQRALAGTWTFTIRDVQSGAQEPWWAIVGSS
jgi:FecR protein